jgi:outer membrane beta-barrel protein
MLSLLAALAIPFAAAQDPVDLGVIRNTDIRVVQKNLYPKSQRTELGVQVGAMPFDAYVFTPNAQFSYFQHANEMLAFGGVVGGGYGLKSATYRELESPMYGVAPAAYRYLASALGGAQAAPIYGKMNLNGKKILHYDVYGAALAGASLESSVIPGGGITVAPTVSLGIGTRVFIGDNAAIRIDFRDDLLLEHRNITDSWNFKQNANILVGYTLFSPRPERP